MTDTDPPDRRRRFSLRTSRMEALSDGIFAIAGTLLVLDLAVPSVRSDVTHALVEQWPQVAVVLCLAIALFVLIPFRAVFRRLRQVRRGSGRGLSRQG